jgi:hypothetical protein
MRLCATVSPLYGMGLWVFGCWGFPGRRAEWPPGFQASPKKHEGRVIYWAIWCREITRCPRSDGTTHEGGAPKKGRRRLRQWRATTQRNEVCISPTAAYVSPQQSRRETGERFRNMHGDVQTISPLNTRCIPMDA